MRYWWRRFLNGATAGQLFKIYSMTYCIDCQKHFPFKGIGKLVSRDHNIKRLKHREHTVRPLGKLRGRPKNYFMMFPVWKPPPDLQVPDEFSLQDWCEETGDQGSEPSCAGFGWKGCYAVGTKLRKGKYPNKGWSPRCGYNGGKKMDGNLQQDGTYCSSVAKFAQICGHCREVDWPYIPWENGPNRHWDDDPTIVVHPDALKIGQTAGWAIVGSVNDIFAAIASYNDVYIGIDWYENWMNVIGYNMPKASGPPVGGHSVHILAYSKKTGRVRIQGSWTKLYGVGGFSDMLISDLEMVFNNGEFLLISFTTPPDPQPQPEPDDWLEKLRKMLEDFLKALTDLFGSMPKKAAR
jgi:hypothetical protein